MPSRSQIENAINQFVTDPLNRQNTAAKIREVLKALNNALFNAQDDELTIQHIQGLEDALLGITGPTPPSGVTWHDAPILTISGNTVTVSAGIANVNGTLKNVPAKSFTPALPAAGFKQPYSAFSDYLSTPAVHEIDGATTVAETASYSWPTVPENRLPVANFMLTNAGITQVGTGAVKSVTINGGAAQFPDATGKLDLTVATGSSNAANIDYAPADSNTTTGFFAGLLTMGGLMVSAALDAIVTAVKARLPIEATSSTGTALTFLTDTYYNTSASPGTGNITIDTTGGKKGVVVVVIHNAGTAPTVNGQAIGTAANACKLIDGSADYKLGVNNYIEFKYLSATEIHYSIYQLKP